jgi:hypothetical protein
MTDLVTLVRPTFSLEQFDGKRPVAIRLLRKVWTRKPPAFSGVATSWLAARVADVYPRCRRSRGLKAAELPAGSLSDSFMPQSASRPFFSCNGVQAARLTPGPEALDGSSSAAPPTGLQRAHGERTGPAHRAHGTGTTSGAAGSERSVPRARWSSAGCATRKRWIKAGTSCRPIGSDGGKAGCAPSAMQLAEHPGGQSPKPTTSWKGPAPSFAPVAGRSRGASPPFATEGLPSSARPRGFTPRWTASSPLLSWGRKVY